jgi:hypothetical protein
MLHIARFCAKISGKLGDVREIWRRSVQILRKICNEAFMAEKKQNHTQSGLAAQYLSQYILSHGNVLGTMVTIKFWVSSSD